MTGVVVLKKGSTGPEVRALQDDLIKIGVYQSDFSAATRKAVMGLQERYGLKVDGIVGPQTRGLIARLVKQPERVKPEAEINGATVPVASPEVAMFRDCPKHIWARFHNVLNLLTGGQWDDILAGRREKAEGVVVRYGPGRGHFLSPEEVQKATDRGYLKPVDLGGASGLWVVTSGPLGMGQSANVRGGWQGPTFHCSSFTNWLMGMLLDYNEEYTHQGNMPGLKACQKTRHSLHAWPIGKNRKAYYRGFAEHCARMAPDGSTPLLYKREYLDAEEIWRRRAELGTINVFGQSTLQRSGKWKIEHHTGVFFVHPHFPNAVFRIAADGSRNSNGYSGTPMNIERITRSEALRLEDKRRYFVYRLHGFPEDAARSCPFVLEV